MGKDLSFFGIVWGILILAFRRELRYTNIREVLVGMHAVRQRECSCERVEVPLNFVHTSFILAPLLLLL
jgi:hypothetical protein